MLSYLLCIVLISRSNQLKLCSVKRTNLMKLDTTKAKQPTKLFYDVEIVIIHEWKIQRIFATIMNCPLLSLPYNNFIIHELLAVFITFFNLFKAFDSSDIHYIRKLTTPPLLFYSKSSHKKKIICFMPVISNVLTSYISNV